MAISSSFQNVTVNWFKTSKTHLSTCWTMMLVFRKPHWNAAFPAAEFNMRLDGVLLSLDKNREKTCAVPLQANYLLATVTLGQLSGWLCLQWTDWMYRVLCVHLEIRFVFNLKEVFKFHKIFQIGLKYECYQSFSCYSIDLELFTILQCLNSFHSCLTYIHSLSFWFTS